MPRAAANKDEAMESAPRKTRARTPAKKTTIRRSSAANEKPRRARATRTARTRATRASREPVVEEVFEEEVVEEVKPAPVKRKRKAPTIFTGLSAEKKARRLQMLIFAGVIASGVAASAAVGITDSGSIDVAQTIEERNERMENMVDVDGPVVVAPAPTINAGNPNLPDGGLIGLQPAPPPAPPLLTAAELAAAATDDVSSTSTSSADGTSDSDSASSTPDGVPEVDGVTTLSATTSVVATTSPES